MNFVTVNGLAQKYNVKHHTMAAIVRDTRLKPVSESRFGRGIMRVYDGDVLVPMVEKAVQALKAKEEKKHAAAKTSTTRHAAAVVVSDAAIRDLTDAVRALERKLDEVLARQDKPATVDPFPELVSFD